MVCFALLLRTRALKKKRFVYSRGKPLKGLTVLRSEETKRMSERAWYGRLRDETLRLYINQSLFFFVAAEKAK